MERQQKEYINHDRSVGCTGNYFRENVIVFKLEKLSVREKQPTNQPTKNCKEVSFILPIQLQLKICIKSLELIISGHTYQSISRAENIFVSL